MYGDPKRFVVMNILGADPSTASPSRVREARNKTPFPDENALVITTAFMIDGSA